MYTHKYKFIPSYPIKVGHMYYFGSLWNGNATEENGMEVLLSGQIETENETVIFTRGEVNERDFRDTIIKVIEIKEEQ